MIKGKGIDIPTRTKYLSKKERIQDELKLMKSIADKGVISKQQKNLEKWFT